MYAESVHFARLRAEKCFSRRRSVKKTCRWHVFSAGRRSYAPRRELSVAGKNLFNSIRVCGRELCEARHGKKPLPRRSAPAAATESAATLSRVSARTLQTARSALLILRPQARFLFPLFLFRKEK